MHVHKSGTFTGRSGACAALLATLFILLQAARAAMSATPMVNCARRDRASVFACAAGVLASVARVLHEATEIVKLLATASALQASWNAVCTDYKMLSA